MHCAARPLSRAGVQGSAEMRRPRGFAAGAADTAVAPPPVPAQFRLSCRLDVPNGLVELDAQAPAGDAAAGLHWVAIGVAVRADGLRARSEATVALSALLEYRGRLRSLREGLVDEVVFSVPHRAPLLSIYRPVASETLELTLRVTMDDRRFAFNASRLQVAQAMLVQLEGWFADVVTRVQALRG